MDSNKSKYIYLIGFLLILALPSLLSLSPWFHPPDWGKTIIFRTILSILLFFFFWQIISGKNREIKEKITFLSYKKNTIFWLLVSLCGLYFLATIFSLDSNTSFWGTPYRSGGFLNFAFYIIFGLLAFLILNKKSWPKIIDFSILIGILVSVIAIFQWQGIFSDFLVSIARRPSSTMGNPIILAIYLLLLSFITLPLVIKEKNIIKKIIYSSALIIFIFTIFLTYSRAAYLGLAVGLLYFFLAYPYKKRAVSLVLKSTFLIFLILGSYGVYYVNTYPFPEFISENKILKDITSRLNIEKALQDSRIFGWQVGIEALKDRPILGYGPENFSIGFDRYYDPALPEIGEISSSSIGSWWDRAHNFILDISVTTGIPTLIVFLTLFATLFWKLKKVKNNPESENTLIAHGIQAALLAYLIANFFSFDTFSIYLILFLLIGYSLYLVKDANPATEKTLARINTIKNPILWKTGLFIILIWFVWSFNIKPFYVNTQINIAKALQEENFCSEAINVMEKTLPQKSFLNNHFRLKYTEIINNCIKDKNPEEIKPLVEKVMDLLEENVETNSYNIRNWFLLGRYNNILIEIWGEKREEQAKYTLEKAYQLSPKRQETIQEIIKTELLSDNYEEAEKRAEQCINLNDKFAGCWWWAGITQAYLGNLEKSDEYLEIARKKRYPVKRKDSQSQLLRAYIEIKNYPGLVQTYSNLIKLDPSNAQNYASLAFVYKEIGQIEKAKKTALKIIELFPKNKVQAENFLKTLE